MSGESNLAKFILKWQATSFELSKFNDKLEELMTEFNLTEAEKQAVRSKDSVQMRKLLGGSVISNNNVITNTDERVIVVIFPQKE